MARPHMIPATLIVILGIAFLWCGGDGARDERGYTDQDVLRLELEIVYEAYEQGRLGSASDVKADMEQYFNRPGFSEPKPFEGDRLIPYERMSDLQRLAFQRWYRGEKVSDVIGPEMTSAKERLIREGTESSR